MTASICPRCRSTEVGVVARSPVPDRWTVHSCATCRYAWRSTEPAAAADPDAYPAEFRLTAADVAAAPRLH